MASDLDILCSARTFSLGVWLPHPATTGGRVFGPDDTVSDAQMFAAAERLVALGYLERKDDLPSAGAKKRAHLVSYEITAAGRTAAREHAGDAPFTVDVARGLHSSDISRVYGDLPEAQRQLELRGRCHALVVGALQALGYEYRDTGGWHVLPHATPEKTLGFVSIADGVAVDTGIDLDSDMIEACTVPGQTEGPVASGAAAWTHPDAGEGRKAQAPRGWVQLLADVRASYRCETQVEPVELGPVQARVVAWCLRTCYDSTGRPGPRRFSQHERQIEPVDAWPCSPERRSEMADIAEAALTDIALDLAEMVSPELRSSVEAALATVHSGVVHFASGGPDAPRYPTRNVSAALDAIGAYAWEPGTDDARDALRAVVQNPGNRPVNIVLREAGVTRLSAFERSTIGGMMINDVCRYLFERVIRERLSAVADALGAAYADAGLKLRPHPKPDQVLGPLVLQFARDIAKRFEDCAAKAYDDVLAAYSRDGYVEVDIPFAAKVAS